MLERALGEVNGWLAVPLSVPPEAFVATSPPEVGEDHQSREDYQSRNKPSPERELRKSKRSSRDRERKEDREEYNEARRQPPTPPAPPTRESATGAHFQEAAGWY